MRIRPNKKGDYSALISTIDSVCAEGDWMHTTQFMLTHAWSQALTQSEPDKTLVLVAEVDDNIVGWCRMFCDDNDPAQAEIGIGVIQPYRNHGIGTQLLEEVQKMTESLRVQHLYLSTRVDNKRAIHLFRKLGFSIQNRLPNGYLSMSNPLHAVPSSQEICS